ncbi:hypothetical protein HYV49_01695 [Candidatus Pacearchaeota archaeon]|nr:hypothetical protein [Candidatus Pacearchaeota archaeon]
MKEEILKVLKELRKSKERKFDQSIDFILNLKKFDPKKESVNLFVFLPHKISDRKICAFLTKKSKIVDTIIKEEFDRFKDKKSIKKLIEQYDFFMASSSLMPVIATKFGRYLGPAGKMPNPQNGVITTETDETVKNVLEKFNTAIRIITKEPSIKLRIGKLSMTDEQIAENVAHVFNILINALPKKQENIKSLMIKLTMSKPVRIKWESK